jgi:hypothetical protein
MQPFDTERPDGSSGRAKTLASLVFPLNTSPDIIHDVEEFRIKYEATHGETDLTKRYTSTWPVEEQQWLLENHPQRYWEGLPPFAKAFLKDTAARAHKCGRLDDLPDVFIKLYFSGKMVLDQDGPHR